LLKDDTIATRV